MNTKEISEKKKNLRLTTKQKEIMSGLLLGDGHLESQNNGKTYRLKVEHSINQKDYVDWLYNIFSNWCQSEPKERIKDSFGKKITSYGFTTYSSGSFRFFANQFYKNHQKIVPKKISHFLSLLTIAVWFMDDGSLKSDKHNNYIIHTLGFKKSECQLLVRSLLKRFKIKATIHRQYEKYRIYIKNESANDFKKIIEPYVLDSMKYKLGNKLPKK